MTTLQHDYPELATFVPNEPSTEAPEPEGWKPKPPPEGNVLVRDMPEDDYHSREALSFHGALKLWQSPAHYHFAREHPKPSTDTQLFGRAVHCGVLEPDRFGAHVVKLPYINRRTNQGKADYAAFVAENAGRIVLGAEDYARAIGCINAVRDNPAAARLLDGATTEASFFWRDAQYGIPCKARVDLMNLGGNVDLKTTDDASPEAFGKMIARNGWHAQSAHYASACEHVLGESPRFVGFIAAEDEPPFGVKCYHLDPASIRAGAHLMAIALARYAEAMASGIWRGYSPTIDRISVPRFALRFDV